MHIDKPRYLAFDFARILAIILMIQGHTIGSIVSSDSITELGILGDIWIIIRSVTSSIFLIVSGMVNFVGIKRDINGRVEKSLLVRRLKRAFALILIDYILIFPVINIFELNNLSSFDWFNFFKVGTLNIIGVSLIFVVLLMKFSKFDKSFATTSLIISIVLISITPIIHSIDWFQYVHSYFAHYLTQNGGSFFSISSHTPFILIGTFIGYYSNELVRINLLKKLNIQLFISGLILAFIGNIFHLNLEFVFTNYNPITSSPFIILSKIGYSLILISLYFKLSEYFSSFSRIISSLSKQNLITYIIHIILIFGTPWSVGIIYYFNAKINLIYALIISIIITFISFLSTYLIIKIKTLNEKINLIFNYSIVIIIILLLLFAKTKFIL